jgi:hypothetical protein
MVGDEDWVRNLDVVTDACWLRDRIAIFRHATKMERDGPANILAYFLDGMARGDTAGKIGDISGIIARTGLDDDRIFHGLSSFSHPACSWIDFHVLGFRSSFG